jgi:hypothetical protein
VRAALPAASEIFGAIMPQGITSSKANRKADSAVFSAKRNELVGWVERSETHQSPRCGVMGFAALYPSYDTVA